ncbi:hypothetical protein [Pollutibacter soli]|uniref:hypothetical protein n=1 Tax=Pollutibacter soli TaxID=3034157 RepID=UPI0030141A0B
MKNLFFAIVIIFGFLSPISSTAQKKALRIDSSMVPADFKEYKDTLLVVDEKLLIGYSKYLRKNFEEHYSGPYKIISRKEYLSFQGGDHRFVFTGVYNYEFAGTESKKVIKYILMDNKTGKHYQTNETKYYSELMINYIKELNAQLKS